MQASINFELNTREWVLQDGYQGKRSTNGTWLYLNEEIPIQSGMLFKSNQTFFQATVEWRAQLAQTTLVFLFTIKPTKRSPLQTEMLGNDTKII